MLLLNSPVTWIIRNTGIASLLLIYALLILLPNTQAQAAPLLQGQTQYEFDAQAFADNMGYRRFRECGSGTVINFVQTQFASKFTPGRYYHVRGAGPSQYPNTLWEIHSFSEISGCPSAKPPPAPPQVTFYADRPNLILGECATVRWDVENVQAVYYNNQGVAGHDSRRECPQSTTMYTLRAVTNSGDINQTVTINVQIPAPQVEFTVDRPTIFASECTTLRWALAYVQSMSLDGIPISNPGTKEVCPKSTTPYTLRATAATGEIVRTVTVTVPPPNLRLADFTLLDPTVHASLTDFTLMDNPTAFSSRILWIRIANDGAPVSNASYELQVVLKGAHGEKLAEYDFASGRPMSLAPISVGNIINIQTVFVPIFFTAAVQTGTIEVFFKPDSALGQRNSILSKAIIPSQPSSTAKKIAFAVNQSTFTNLMVVGPNQYGVETTWSDPDSYAKHVSQTDAYWWQDTAVLTFYVSGVGWRGCIIDYLSDSPDFDTVAITYTEGSGCSGSSGSAAIHIPENAARDYRAANTVMLPFKCLKSLAKQLTGAGNIILLSWDCMISPGIKVAEIIAAQYGKRISSQDDTAPPAVTDSSATTPGVQPTESAPPASPSSSPSLSPTFGFVGLRWEPASPTWGNDVVFYAKFNNTFPEQRYLSWRIEICTPDCPNWTKLMFQTDLKQEFVPPGGMSEVVSKPWPLRGKGGLQTYPVRFVHIAPDGTRTGEQVFYVTVNP